MNLLRLVSPVVISGKDIFGRRAQINFSPSDLPGWYWKCGSEIVPITSDIALRNPRRITLSYKNHLLEIYEHIGALRWTGLDNVVIESSKFPPFHGRTAELWHALKPFCKKTCAKIPWIKTDRAYAEIISAKDSRSVSLAPANCQNLILTIILKIKGLGAMTKDYELPMPLDEIFETHTLGWPSHLYHFSRLAGLLGWPHHKHIEWAQKNSHDDLLKKICLHRAGDLLGALSLITHDRLVSGKVVSHKGGHKLDIDMVKKIKLH